MKDYLFVLIIAAVVTYLLTPLVRQGAIALHAQHAARSRDVHKDPTPLLGGLAMWFARRLAGLFATPLTWRILDGSVKPGSTAVVSMYPTRPPLGA